MEIQKVFIFLNGDFEESHLHTSLASDNAYLIGVDGGVRHLRKLGTIPNLVIGDFDSISSYEINWITENAEETRRFPAEKDQTDFELALDRAMEIGCKEIRVYGALGGRMDHTLANISLLSNPRYSDIHICLINGTESLFFIQKQTTISGKKGDIVSLLPWGESVTGVTTSGLKYPLEEEILFSFGSRGLSNILESGNATITFKKGNLLCVLQSSPV
jgi:thiamine pyrophosphokinase